MIAGGMLVLVLWAALGTLHLPSIIGNAQVDEQTYYVAAGRDTVRLAPDPERTLLVLADTSARAASWLRQHAGREVGAVVDAGRGHGAMVVVARPPRHSSIAKFTARYPEVSVRPVFPGARHESGEIVVAFASGVNRRDIAAFARATRLRPIRRVERAPGDTSSWLFVDTDWPAGSTIAHSRTLYEEPAVRDAVPVFAGPRLRQNAKN